MSISRIALTAALLLSILGTGPVEGRAWESLPMSTDPGTGCAFAVDGVHRYAYAFGGTVDNVARNTLYRQDLDDPEMKWELLASETPARTNARAFFDHRRGRLLVLGGQAAGFPPSDIWAWDAGLAQWSHPPVAGTAPSSINSSNALAYDSRRDRLLYVNNQGASGSPAVWGLEIGGDTLRWSRLDITGGFAPLAAGAAAAYDSLSDRMFLKQTGSTGLLVLRADSADSFQFVPVPITNSFALPFLLIDPVHRRMVVISNMNGFTDDTSVMTFDLDTYAYTMKSDPYQPVPPYLRAWAEDPVQHSIVAMSWRGSTPARSVLSTSDDAVAWARLHPSGLPYTHRGMAGVTVGRWAYVYGGVSVERDDCNPPPCLSQKLHRFSLDDPRVHEELFPTGPSPGPRYHMSAVYDSAGARILFYGGLAPGNVLMTDCWALELEPSLHWTPVATDVPGPASVAPVAALDPATRFMYVAAQTSSPRQVFWRLDLSQQPAAWTHLPWNTAPDATNMLGFDRARNVLIALGRYNGITVDTLGTADSVHVDASYLGRDGIYGVFDSTRNCLLAYGGWATNTMTTAYRPRQSLAFTGASLLDMQASLPTVVPPDANGFMVHDPVLDRLLVLNGEVEGGSYSGSPQLVPHFGLWTLQLDAAVPVLPGPVSADYSGGVVTVRFFGHVENGGVDVERLELPGDTWIGIGTATTLNGELYEFVDRDVTPGARYRYRFRYGGDAVSDPTSEVTIPGVSGAEFALSVRGGAVNRGWPLVVDVRVAPGHAARIDLIDVSGRLACRKELDRTDGAATVALSPARPAAGVYFVRLTQGPRSITEKVVHF